MNVNLPIILEEFLAYIREEFNVELSDMSHNGTILNGTRKIELIDNFIMEYLPGKEAINAYRFRP